jgi:stalled ribosome rescue protein Dom34
LEQVASPNIKAEGENNMKKTHNQARSQRIGIYHTIEIQIFQIFQGSKKFKEWMHRIARSAWSMLTRIKVTLQQRFGLINSSTAHPE